MLKVVVIGVGSMGQNHVRLCSESANLVGVMDLDGKKAQTISKKYNVKPYSKLDDLLSSDIDAVIVATPTFTHYEIGKKAIQQGKHLLIEKPMCEKVENAIELYNLAKDRGTTLAVGHVERHNPVVRFAKDIVEKKKYGGLISQAATRVSSLPPRIKDVGVILDLGIHDIDIMRYLASSEVERVFAYASKENTSAAFEDRANILMRFKDGSCGYIEANWLTQSKIRTLKLTLEKVVAELNYTDQAVQIYSSELKKYDESDLSPAKMPWQYSTQNIMLKKEEPLKNELVDFFSAIEQKRKPLVTGYDGIKTLQIAQAAAQSYKTNKEVELENEL